MNDIVTVNGPIRHAEAGICSVGEHLVARFRVDRPRLATDTWFYEQRVRIELLGDLMLGRANRDDAEIGPEAAGIDLRNFASRGGGLVVETTAPSEGRDPALLARLARDTGVRIVMAASACDASHDALIAELRDGIDGVRAGLVNIAPDAGAAALDAGFSAALATGAPVRLELGPGLEAALSAVALAARMGLDPARIAITGAAALVPAPDALRELLATGVHVAFDRLGRIPTIRTTIADHDIAVAIAGLVGMHGDRILLGTCIDRKHAMNAFGGNGLRFVPAQFLPYLAHMGVGPEAADRLATTNPARFLTWKEAAA